MTSIRKRLESGSLIQDESALEWFYTNYGKTPLCCCSKKGDTIECESVGRLSSDEFKVECLKCQQYVRSKLMR